MSARLPPRRPSLSAQISPPFSREGSPSRRASPSRTPASSVPSGTASLSVRTKSPARVSTADYIPSAPNPNNGKPPLPVSDVQSRIPVVFNDPTARVAMPGIPLKDRKSLASVAATIQKGAREAAQEANRRTDVKRQMQAAQQGMSAFSAFARFAGGPSAIQKTAPPIPPASIVRPSPSSQKLTQTQIGGSQPKAEFPMLRSFLEQQKRARQGKGPAWTWIPLLEAAQGCAPQAKDKVLELQVTWIGFLPKDVQQECPTALASISFSCLIRDERKAIMGTIGKSPWSDPEIVKRRFVSAQKIAQALHPDPADTNARKAAIAQRLKVIMWRLSDGTPQVGLKYVDIGAASQTGTGGSSSGRTR